MEDSHGHFINYLRVSVTDRCNERCRYCMPEEIQNWTPKDETLSYDEFLRLIRVGATLGITKIRITGGEPLTRPGIEDFCAAVASLPGIRDVGISTNGTMLSKKTSEGLTLAKALVNAGVRSANISLDTLDRAAYQRTTGRDLLPAVIEGIDAAIDAGFQSIKLNAVLIKHQTESALIPLVEFARQKQALLRFIELMPVSTSEVLHDDNFLPTATARKLIESQLGPLVPVPDFKTNGPSTYYKVPGTEQLIGFIGALTNLHFCESCNKLRLTSDGKLRPCLGSHLEFDLRTALRSGASDEELRSLILATVARKPKEHDFRNNYQPQRRMIAIGG
ncbi:MAG: GTP 3',8-cyclase MoaA [Verrucomicrobiaceae bacterium]|nr:GTP 3',8-cyclase MoaA [Verrucomicrobiaceae bacterium]